MGYDTTYKLNKPVQLQARIQKELIRISDYFNTDDDIMDLENGFMNCKWYEHEEELRELSTKFPNILFELEGHGEENDDMWIKYFKNGKMQRCNAIITFEPYDKTKLH